MELNICTLARDYSDEDAVYGLVEKLRWPNGPVCPHCGDTGRAYFLKSRNGHRTTSTGRTTYRRLWKCAACRKQFSVLVGTIFESSKVPLSKWLLAIYMMNSSKNGVAAYELHRALRVTNKTAWFMLHRIREAMKAEPVAAMFRGVVVADETFFGGRAKNRHKSDRRSPVTPVADGTPIVPGQREKANRGPRNGGPWSKTAVLTLIERSTGEARSRVVPDVTGATLRKAIAEHCDIPNTILHTDEGVGYKPIAHEFAAHETVNHSKDEYVRYEGGRVVTSNQAENFFSQLRRSIDGTHHHVSAEHLGRYLAEFDFRYSTRKASDSDRMAMLMGRTGGRRLTYMRVTASG